MSEKPIKRTIIPSAMVASLFLDARQYFAEIAADRKSRNNGVPTFAELCRRARQRNSKDSHAK